MPLGTEVGLGPGGIVRWDPAHPTERGTSVPPLFGPLCSGTVAHLSSCFIVAQLTADSSFTLQWAANFPSKLHLRIGDLDPI